MAARVAPLIWAVKIMSARYRVREHKQKFTPQKRIFGMWLRIASAQATMHAANEIIRHKLKSERPAGHVQKSVLHNHPPPQR
jgi:hypothetical protein